MKHLNEEEIVLHFYGDAESEEDVRQHLEQCLACRAEFERVQTLLQQIEPVEVPDPPSVYEEKTWLNLRDLLPEQRRGFREWLRSPRKWALAGTMALLLVMAFAAGRFWPRHGETARENPPVANPRRVVLVAVGSHLERSQMLLVEIMNTNPKGTVDLSTEQQQARDLLDANHLYRVSAQRTGDPQVERLLDELGRVLAEIANGPSELPAGDLEQIRNRIQSESLLFKVRVIGSEVNSRALRPESPAEAKTQRL